MSNIKILEITKDESNKNPKMSRYLLFLDINGDKVNSCVEFEYIPFKLINNSELEFLLGRHSAALVTRIVDNFNDGNSIDFPVEVTCGQLEQ
jgi:hypothetical protein